MIGQETDTTIPYVEADRLANRKERFLWNRADELSKRIALKAYKMQVQWSQIKFTHDFAVDNKVNFVEPDFDTYTDRMFSVLKEIEALKQAMCGVNSLRLGIKISENGNDIDIVEPKENQFGWIKPAIIVAIVIGSVIARWIYLEKEVSEISTKYDLVIKRSDRALCEDPNSDLCEKWKKSKAAGDYYTRQTIIDQVKETVSSVGETAKKGLGYSLLLAIPLLIWIYGPRRR
jgi:hypothetical protein